MPRACGRVELARLFVIVGGLVVALLTAALVAPYFIDWTSYRSDFEREASRILGRKVTVEGTARARLLPFPSVTFTDVTVAGATPDEPAMTVQEFSMDAELAPFLSGEVLIFDMRLVRPSASIDIDENGRIDWAVRPSTPFDPSQVTLEKVTITDGTIAIAHHAGGRTHMLTDIDAVLSARSLAGPWRIDGNLAVDGVPTALSISTGTAKPDEGIRVHVDASPQPYPLRIETDGRISLDEQDVASYEGTFRLQTRTATEDAAHASPAAPESDAVSANRVTGKFSLGNERLEIEEFRLAAGPLDDPYTADGQAFVDIGPEPRFSVTADGARIDFDEPAGEQGKGVAALPLKDRLAAFRAFLLGMPRPAMPGTVRVNLPAIVAGDTTIREISLEAEPAENGWSVKSIAATLPGRARFEAHGLLTTEDRLAFAGSVLLAVKQPSGFAAWLARDVDDAIRRLPAAGFSADVDLTGERQSFRNMELVLGDARFYGSIERRQPANARPSMSVVLEGDKLDVEGMTAFASLFVSDEGTTRLADHDIDFDIKTGPVSVFGLTADSVDTALRLQQGRLEIDRLKIDGLAGASVSATGTLSDFAAEPKGKLDASIVAVDLAPLVAALAQRFPENRLVGFLERRAHFYPGLLEDAEIDFVASAAAGKAGATGLAISANGKAGGTAFSVGASGSGDLRSLGKASLDVAFSARNDEAATLYALYGLPAVPLGFAGRAESDLSLKGTLESGAETHFVFSGDGFEARADGTATWSGDEPAFSGTGRLKTGDLEPWLAAAGIALPGFGFGMPADLHSDLDLHDGRLMLNGLGGSVLGSGLAGNLSAEMKDAGPHLTGSLDLDTFDLSFPAAMVVGDSMLAAGTGAPWPENPFRQDVGSPFTADVELGVKSLSFSGRHVGSAARMDFSLDREGLRLSNVGVDFEGGRLSGLLAFKNNGGSGLLSAQMKLENADLAALLPQDAVSGRIDASASLTASGKSVEGMIAGLSGSGSAVFDDLVIGGMNPRGFGPIIREADEIGHEINAADTARFAPDIVRSGAFQAGTAELAFTVAGGVVRTPPLQLHDGKTVMTVETRADLSTAEAEIKGSLAYDAGLEAIAGADPVVQFSVSGPVEAMHTRIETQPLAQYLTQRALEREQARVEHMQAVLLEKQRLRREANYYAALQDIRRRAEEERRHLARETERLRRQAEVKAREEAERARQEAEARRQAEEEAERKAREEMERQVAPEEPESPQRDDQSASGDDDDVQTYFRAKDLTVEGLMKLLGPRQ